MKKLLKPILSSLFIIISFISNAQVNANDPLITFDPDVINTRITKEQEILNLSKKIKAKKDSIISLELPGHPKSEILNLSENDSLVLINNLSLQSEINNILPSLINKSYLYLKTYWQFTDNDFVEAFGSTNSEGIYYWYT